MKHLVGILLAGCLLIPLDSGAADLSDRLCRNMATIAEGIADRRSWGWSLGQVMEEAEERFGSDSNEYWLVHVLAVLAGKDGNPDSEAFARWVYEGCMRGKMEC